MTERVSIVISARDEASELRRTLRSLSQLHSDRAFEIIVVSPSDLELGEFASLVRWVRAPDEGRAVVWNLGSLHAAGDVLVFLDAGTVPDPGWLDELIDPFDWPGVGGVGGILFRNDGKSLRHSFTVCDRLGERWTVRPTQSSVFCRPHADPFLLLHHSNCAFRRDVILQAQGWDESLESDLAAAEFCLRLCDLGISLRPLQGAPVYQAPDDDLLDPPAPPPDDPTQQVRDLCCLALRYGRVQRSTAEVLAVLKERVEQLQARARIESRERRWPNSHVEFYRNQLERALGSGIELGLAQQRRGRELTPAPTDGFLRFSPVRPEGIRRTFAFVCPPGSTRSGWEGRLRSIAEGCAARGHTTHLFVPDHETNRLQWVDGVWEHRLQGNRSQRWDLASLPNHARHQVGYADTIYETLSQIRAGRRIDLIVAPTEGAPSLVTRSDISMPCVLIGRAGCDPSELERATFASGRDVLPALPTGGASEFLVWGEDWITSREQAVDALRETRFSPGSRLRVSLVSAFIEPRDATSNVCRVQMDALSRYARANDIRLDLRAFVLRSRVDDPRVWVVSDAAALTMDPHFLASDLIIYHFGYYNPLFESLPLAPPSARRVVNYHGITPPELFRPDKRAMILESFRQGTHLPVADQVIVQSQSVRSQVQELGVAPEKIDVMPLSIPFARELLHEQSTSVPPSSTDRELRLIYVGRFVPSKGVLDLLEAVAVWRTNSPDRFRLDLCGNRFFSDQAYLELLFHTVKRRGLTDVVQFHFDVPDSTLVKKLKAADVMVMPSHHEGFCVPVIEAFGCGTAVIHTDAAALPETAGGFGLCFPTGDIAVLSEYLRLFRAAHDRGHVLTDRGEPSRQDWLREVGLFLDTFTESAYAERFCRAIFSRIPGAPQADTHLSSLMHRDALRKFRDAETCPTRPAPQSELLRCLVEVAPVDSAPSSRCQPPTRYDRIGILFQSLRSRLYRVPLVGKTCRYVKRLVCLPWNFHNLYQEFQQNEALRRNRNDQS